MKKENWVLLLVSSAHIKINFHNCENTSNVITYLGHSNSILKQDKAIIRACKKSLGDSVFTVEDFIKGLIHKNDGFIDNLERAEESFSGKKKNRKLMSVYEAKQIELPEVNFTVANAIIPFVAHPGVIDILDNPVDNIALEAAEEAAVPEPDSEPATEPEATVEEVFDTTSGSSNNGLNDTAEEEFILDEEGSAKVLNVARNMLSYFEETDADIREACIEAKNAFETFREKMRDATRTVRCYKQELKSELRAATCRSRHGHLEEVSGPEPEVVAQEVGTVQESDEE